MTTQDTQWSGPHRPSLNEPPAYANAGPRLRIPQVEPSCQGRIAFPADSSKQPWVASSLFQYLILWACEPVSPQTAQLPDGHVRPLRTDLGCATFTFGFLTGQIAGHRRQATPRLRRSFRCL